LTLPAQVQRFSTGDQRLDARAGRQEVGHLGRRGGHVLEVVGHEQELPIVQMLAKAIQDRPVGGFLDAERLGDARHDQVGRDDGGELDEPRAVRELAE
jgi:hypothetical protein